MSDKKERAICDDIHGQVVPMPQPFLTATRQETEQRFVEEHIAVKSAFKAMLCHAKAAGDLLSREKARLKAEGMFTLWLTNMCERRKIHVSTAFDYIRISENWEAIQENAGNAGLEVEDLSINKALSLVKSTEELIAKAKERAKDSQMRARNALDQKARAAGQHSELLTFAMENWPEVCSTAAKEGVDISTFTKGSTDALALIRRVKERREQHENRKKRREKLPPGSLVLLLNDTEVEEVEVKDVRLIKAAMAHWQIGCDITQAIGFLLSLGKSPSVCECAHPTVVITEEIGSLSQAAAKPAKPTKMAVAKANPNEVEQTELQLPAR